MRMKRFLRTDGSDRVTPILDYFEDIFIGRPRRRNGRRGPRFPLKLWNVYERVEMPRTNDDVEGWHTSFQSGVGAHHPNFWRFLDVLKREQSLNQLNINQMIVVFDPPSQRRQYVNAGKRIAAIVGDFPIHHILTYLRGIAHNLQL